MHIFIAILLLLGIFVLFLIGLKVSTREHNELSKKAEDYDTYLHTVRARAYLSTSSEALEMLYQELRSKFKDGVSLKNRTDANFLMGFIKGKFWGLKKISEVNNVKY